MTKFTFEGVVTIHMTTRATIVEGTDEPNKITLHAKELSFRKAEYRIVGGSSTNPSSPGGGGVVVADEVRKKIFNRQMKNSKRTKRAYTHIHTHNNRNERHCQAFGAMS